MTKWFRVLHLKSRGPWFKSSSLPLSGFALSSPVMREFAVPQTILYYLENYEKKSQQ